MERVRVSAGQRTPEADDGTSRATPPAVSPWPHRTTAAHRTSRNTRLHGTAAARAHIDLHRQFLDQSRFTTLTGQCIALAVFVDLYLYAHASSRALLLWLVACTTVNTVRLALLARWRRRPGAWRRRARVFAVTALAAGASWGTLMAFYGPRLPHSTQLLVLAVLLGLPVAALPSEALYPPAHTLFSAPIFLALLLWALHAPTPPDSALMFAALVYALFVWVCARRYRTHLRRSISTGLARERLVERLLSHNQRLSSLAFVDPLTGLGNRRWFETQFAQAMGRRERRASRLALMIIDVDGFKEVNDRHGHETGDRVLTTLAKRLRECLRPSDSIARGPGLAARLGGDEFVILIEDVGDTADAVAARIQEHLSAEIDAEPLHLGLTVSVGVALAPEHGADLPSLTRAADRSLYQAKRGGKNRYVLAASP